MVRMYLDASIQHLTPGTVEKLENKNISGVVSYSYEEGLFIIVPEKQNAYIFQDVNKMPFDLVCLIDYAWRNFITLIRLDRDADIINEGLSVYSWD